MNEFDKIYDKHVQQLDEGLWDGIKNVVKSIGNAVKNGIGKDDKKPETTEEIFKAAKEAPKNWDDASKKLADSVASAINTLATKTKGENPTTYMGVASPAINKFTALLKDAVGKKFKVIQVAAAKKTAEAVKKQ